MKNENKVKLMKERGKQTYTRPEILVIASSTPNNTKNIHFHFSGLYRQTHIKHKIRDFEESHV